MNVWEETFVHAYKCKKNGCFGYFNGSDSFAGVFWRDFGTNTLFLLAGAAFCIGIIIKEYGLKTGVAFFIGSVILSLLFTPQKLHCITFALMGGYIVLIEAVFRILGMHPDWKQRKLYFNLSKVLVFNLLYLPALFIAPKLFFAGKLSDKARFILILGGQAALFIYDKAYEYFLVQIWEKLRNKLFGKQN